MIIVGISCYYHDSSAAILKDGMLIAAAEEERFSRNKHESRFPAEAIAYCLEEAGVSIHDVDYVTFFEKPLKKFDRFYQNLLHISPDCKETTCIAGIVHTGKTLGKRGSPEKFKNTRREAPFY